jgi:hypothetical protein
VSFFNGTATEIDTTPIKIRDFIIQTNGGTLDFYRQITCCASTTFDVRIERLTFSSFAGFTTDADFRTDLGGQPFGAGVGAGRSADGRTVDFSYVNGVHFTTGIVTQPIFIKTNAMAFNEGGVLTFSPIGQGPALSNQNFPRVLSTRGLRS